MVIAVKSGLDLICFFSDKHEWDFDFYLQCAQLAEVAGLDVYFIWDHICGYWEGNLHTVDPWILFSNVAPKTETMKLGPMVTPLVRRRPWKLARETVTLVHLSDGRLILGVSIHHQMGEWTYLPEAEGSSLIFVAFTT